MYLAQEIPDKIGKKGKYTKLEETLLSHFGKHLLLSASFRLYSPILWPHDAKN